MGRDSTTSNALLHDPQIRVFFLIRSPFSLVGRAPSNPFSRIEEARVATILPSLDFAELFLSPNLGCWGLDIGARLNLDWFNIGNYISYGDWLIT